MKQFVQSFIGTVEIVGDYINTAVGGPGDVVHHAITVTILVIRLAGLVRFIKPFYRSQTESSCQFFFW